MPSLELAPTPVTFRDEYFDLTIQSLQWVSTTCIGSCKLYGMQSRVFPSACSSAAHPKMVDPAIYTWYYLQILARLDNHNPTRLAVELNVRDMVFLTPDGYEIEWTTRLPYKRPFCDYVDPYDAQEQVTIRHGLRGIVSGRIFVPEELTDPSNPVTTVETLRWYLHVKADVPAEDNNPLGKVFGMYRPYRLRLVIENRVLQSLEDE